MANSTSAARARSLKHQAQALDLRRAGLSYATIAQKIGIGKSQAHKLVQVGMANARAQISASADELKSEELSRLDGMLEKLWPKARKGDVAAVDRVLKIGEARRRLLGLDAPQRTALEGTEGAAPISTAAVVTFYMPDNGRGG